MVKKKCIQSLFDNIYLVILQITIKKKYCNNYDCYTSIRTANNSYKHINCDGKLVDLNQLVKNIEIEYLSVLYSQTRDSYPGGDEK